MLTEYNQRTNLFRVNQPTDILKDLLQDKRSPATRNGYERDLKEFFNYAVGQLPSIRSVNWGKKRKSTGSVV